MSLVSVLDEEWRSRKISMMEVFRSFIYQFKPGQDLTKVSLPSVLCHPFSMLEIIAQRKLAFIHSLFEGLHDENATLKRMLSVVGYYFTVTRAETIEKKPYNPVIGEKHFCWTKHSDGSFTEFISEQVSHHPPVSAYVIENKKTGVRYMGNMQFKVSFGSNYVSVVTEGFGKIYFGDEVYELSKSIPDMIIRNTVWGKKYIMWIGKFEITCPETGYFVELEYIEGKDKKNEINGYLKHRDSDDVIYHISGECGETLYYYTPEDEDDKQIIINMNETNENDICYLGEDQWDDLSSLNVWKEVNQAIVINDMRIADAEKKKNRRGTKKTNCFKKRRRINR